MPTNILIAAEEISPIVWADTTDYNSAFSGYTRTHQIDLTSLAATKAREGAKADLTAVFAHRLAVRACIEYAVAPAIAAVTEIYWSASASGTAGVGNDAECTGADAAYKDAAEEEWCNRLTLIGVHSATADASDVSQMRSCGEFLPWTRYGSIVVWNRTAQALAANAVDMCVALCPLPWQSQ